MLNLLNERSKKLFTDAKKVILMELIHQLEHLNQLVEIQFLLKKQKEHIYMMKMVINTLILYHLGVL